MAGSNFVPRSTFAHDSRALNYGHYGPAEYDEDNHQWHFIRKSDIIDKSLHDQQEEQSRPQHDAGSIKIISAIQPSLPTCEDPIAATIEPNTRKQFRHAVRITPHTTAIPTSLFALFKNRPQSSAAPVAPFGYRLAFGNAAWLGEVDSRSKSRLAPIVAHVAGENGERVRLVCLGQERRTLHDSENDNIKVEYDVPSLSGAEETTWHHRYEPILQLCFSKTRHDICGDSYLAVRQASSTTILKPLLRPSQHIQHDVANSKTSASVLDPNKLVTVPCSATGGSQHVHVAFHPRSPELFAIVDAEGYWSIWRMKGHRRATVPCLYRVKLRSYGKLSTQPAKRRSSRRSSPLDIWHKTCFLSSTGEDADRLLVCSRQHAILYGLDGAQKGALDPVLGLEDTRNRVLDIQPAQRAGICLVLTSTRLILIDVSEDDWKSSATERSPALLCAWNHSRGRGDMSPKMTFCEAANRLYVILYSSLDPLVTVYVFHMDEVNGSLRITSTDPVASWLPFESEKTPEFLALHLIEATARGKKAHAMHRDLAKLFICYDDLSVQDLILDLAVRDRPFERSHSPVGKLALPSRRVRNRKSTHFIEEDGENGEDGEDGEDDTSFNDHTEKRTNEGGAPRSPRRNHDILSPIQNSRASASTTIDLSKFYNDFASLESVKQMSRNHSWHDAVSQTEGELQRLMRNTRVFQPRPLSSLTPALTYIEDVEQASEAVSSWTEKICRRLHQDPAAQLLVVPATPSAFQSLLQIYEQIFESWISPMSPILSDRIRVHAERRARGIALQIYVSHFIVRRKAAKTMDELAFTVPEVKKNVRSAAASSLERLVVSDPVGPPSSQPVTESDRTVISAESSVSAAYRRLTAYSAVDSKIVQTSSKISRRRSPMVDDILAHLPVSAETDPSTYDYRATELDLSISRHEAQTAELDPRSRRRAARLARAKRKALDRQQRLRQANAANSAAVPQLLSRHDNEGDLDNVPITYANNSIRLPIREFQAVPPTITATTKSPIPQVKFTASSPPPFETAGPTLGLEQGKDKGRESLAAAVDTQPSSSQSQGMSFEPISMTQPERGAFGGRLQEGGTLGGPLSRAKGKGNDKDVNSQGKPKKKKKKKMPGF